MLDTIRASGFALRLDEPGDGGIAQLLGVLRAAGGDVAPLIDELMRRLARDEELLRSLDRRHVPVRSISAPVFDADGDVLLAVSLVNFPRVITVDLVGPYVRELFELTDFVTRRIGGTPHPRRASLADGAPENVLHDHPLDSELVSTGERT
jgi:hypothetical protein